MECLFGKRAPSFYCWLWSKWKQKSQYLDVPNLISGFEVCSGYCSPIQQDCLVKNQFRCLFCHCLWTCNNLYDLCNCYHWNPETMEVGTFWRQHDATRGVARSVEGTLPRGWPKQLWFWSSLGACPIVGGMTEVASCHLQKLPTSRPETLH